MIKNLIIFDCKVQHKVLSNSCETILQLYNNLILSYFITLYYDSLHIHILKLPLSKSWNIKIFSKMLGI